VNDPIFGALLPDGKFRVSFLIQFALWSLYLTLMVPLLLFIEYCSGMHMPMVWGCSGVLLGAVLLQAALSETVLLFEKGMVLHYPRWILPIFRRGWTVEWQKIQTLTARSTGQGGLVYYLVTPTAAYLLPTRIAGFKRMVQIIERKTNLDVACVKPLAQPWMYGMVLLVSLGMGLFDVWFFWMTRALQG
jgi:hypothetical protein